MATDTLYTSKKTGHNYFRSAPLYDQNNLSIDAPGGVIKNVSVVSMGAAKGHGVYLDESFVNEVVRLGNEHPQGLKCRFGHPNLSSEALGTFLGRFKNFRSINQRAIADLYLDAVAKKAPGGDLYSWVVEMAQKNPDQFGVSIVFEDDGLYQIIDGEKTPVDYDNDGHIKLADETQPTYIAIKSLNGADVVDEPAANEGLFSSTKFNADKFAVRVTEFLDSNPDIWAFIDNNPGKFEPFLQRYNAYKNKQSFSMHNKKAKTFFQRLAAAFTAEDEKFAAIDAVTTDGKNIRIDAAGDAPGVGDPLYIVDTETSEQTVAPDGDYTINGGDFDAYKCTVVDGKITAVFNPNTPDVTVQQSAIPSYKEMQKENGELKNSVEELTKKLSALQGEFTAFKKSALDQHTNVINEEVEPDKTYEFFAAKPWNKRAKKKSA
jgi:hypothetical protein